MKIVAPRVSHVSYVAANLRPEDVREYESVFGNSDNVANNLLAITAGSKDYAWCVERDGQPYFIYGVYVNEVTPHVGVAWGFGTTRASRAIPVVTRHIDEVLTPLFISSPLNRIEVRVLASAESSVRWLAEYMGAEFECVLKDQGAKRETFYQYAWTRTHHGKP